MSVIELTTAMSLLMMLLATFFVAFSGVLRDSASADQRASLERDLRPVINQMVIQIRQAVPGDSVASPAVVFALSDRTLVFHSDRETPEGPERYGYRTTNCDGVVCDLVLDTTYANPGTGPSWVYDAVPDRSWTVLERVQIANPIFVGSLVDESGSATVTACGGGGPECVLTSVTVDISLAPADRPDAPRPLRIVEDVLLRNAVT